MSRPDLFASYVTKRVGEITSSYSNRLNTNNKIIFELQYNIVRNRLAGTKPWLELELQFRLEVNKAKLELAQA